MTIASSDKIVCTDEVRILLVQKCDDRCKAWSAPDCVWILLKQPVGLSAFAVVLAGLAGLILLVNAQSLQGLFLQLWPLKLPGALDAHLWSDHEKDIARCQVLWMLTFDQFTNKT